MAVEKVYNEAEQLFMEEFSELVSDTYIDGVLTFGQILELSIKVIGDIQQCEMDVKKGVINL